MLISGEYRRDSSLSYFFLAINLLTSPVLCDMFGGVDWRLIFWFCWVPEDVNCWFFYTCTWVSVITCQAVLLNSCGWNSARSVCSRIDLLCNICARCALWKCKYARRRVVRILLNADSGSDPWRSFSSGRGVVLQMHVEVSIQVEGGAWEVGRVGR